MNLICDLLESSVNIQQQLIQNKGFLTISYLMEKVCRAIVFCRMSGVNRLDEEFCHGNKIHFSLQCIRVKYKQFFL